MKTKFCAFLLLLTLGGGAHAATLSGTAQAAVLSKKIIAAYIAEDYATTTKLFMEYDQLDAAMPLPLMLVRVRAYYHLGEFVAAYQILGDYLNIALPDSPDYEIALDMYIVLEAKPELTETLAEAEAEAKVDARFAEAVGRPPSPTAKDANGWTDLHYAAVLDLSSLAKRLLQSGATVDARLKSDNEPFTDELKATLRRFGEDYDGWNRDGETPLHLAARNNAVATATLLVERGAAVNAKDDVGWTPLHYAAWKNAVATATLLVERGAAVNAKDDKGATSLHYAAVTNAVSTATLLVERGAAVNAKTKMGRTPLHIAAWKNARATATLLVERGAAVNAKDDGGETPLHDAARKNAVATATLLIERGATVNAKNNRGRTPLAIALRYDADEIAALLRQHGQHSGKK